MLRRPDIPGQLLEWMDWVGCSLVVVEQFFHIMCPKSFYFSSRTSEAMHCNRSARTEDEGIANKLAQFSFSLITTRALEIILWMQIATYS
ncbi:unnamed protein product [Leptidea sinapis]|uniref:Uncharacterized protein n=1 Tax=Leptidea sinapis TaxID=189913 RepID=A0A5E4QYC0_9NEOP|nr:unnamed protein product [Leptidea sinapis]